MLTERGVVVAYHGGKATIKCQRQGGCTACTAKDSCGSAALSDLTNEKKNKSDHVFIIETLTPLRIGQQVEIGLKEKALVLASLLLYTIPLLTLVVSTIVSQYFCSSELICIAIIFACTTLCFFIVKIFADKLASHPAYQPILLRVYP
ncbi:hypothetical protein A6A19_05900 [Actinobacillus delphinicola]|uniref:Sigma E positive regulator RseC/MucC n=1 Tax=Actinobacillus delphinicola TaxID=51161 RepID=A0A448TTD0_9PAST|nr:SoxR reducing system RseC family protein [Actinobacillus delphinicola]MDG6897524.1 hypothetical protein [Actinobacillus delphinicola]VEJ09252.1 sigma E positive regulator RseC/MucC [Actinobacillus delphinicola]